MASNYEITKFFWILINYLLLYLASEIFLIFKKKFILFKIVIYFLIRFISCYFIENKVLMQITFTEIS
jgi:hypothetical protein